jgi:hypothetical protein
MRCMSIMGKLNIRTAEFFILCFLKKARGGDNPLYVATYIPFAFSLIL